MSFSNLSISSPLISFKVPCSYSLKFDTAFSRIFTYFVSISFSLSWNISLNTFGVSLCVGGGKPYIISNAWLGFKTP